MSGGGKGRQSSSTTSQVSYSPQEEARRQQVFDIGSGLYNTMAPSAGEYRGPTPVGFDPATAMAQGLQFQNAGFAQNLLQPGFNAVDFASNRPQSTAPYADQALVAAMSQPAGSRDQATGALNFALNAPDVNNNPYLTSAIQAAIRPVTENFQNSVIPALRTGGVASGALGSSRQGVAEGLAAQGLTNKVGDIASSMASTGYGQGLDAQSRALSAYNSMVQGALGGANQVGNLTDTSVAAARAIPGLASAASIPGSMLSGVGAQRENLAQEYANYEAAQRIAEVNQPWDLLNSYAGLLSSMSNPITTTTGTAPRQGISPIQGIGALGSLVSLGGKLCWIARLVFGEDSPKWLYFRGWLEFHPVVKYLYGHFGERVAKWLRPRPRMQALVRTLMQRIIAKYETA